MRSRLLALAAASAFLAGCPNDKPLVTSFSVGGTVTGLLGGGLVLQNNLSDTVEVNQDGPFAFPIKLSKWTNYEVTIKEQPTLPAQTCTVENGAGTVTGEITDIRVTCTTPDFSVGGAVLGLAGAGLVLEDESGVELPVAAGATSYAFRFPSGAHYALSVKAQPVRPSQTCQLWNSVGTVGTRDIDDIPLSCATDRFSVGGAVVGLAGSGLVVASGSGEEVAVPSSAASYAFDLDSGVSYAIYVKTQPTNPQQTCVVDNASGVVDDAPIDNASITCTTDAFTVGGPITGLAGSGLVLTNNGGSDLLVGAGQTSYAFVLPNGSAYDIQVKTQPTSPRQTCVVSNGTGTVGAASVTNAAVTCVTDAYAVGGPITGLVGAGLVLQNNGKDDLAVPANATSYSFLVQSGATYALTVKAQPASPSQTCVIGNSSGTMAASPVTNAAITCTTNTYTVGGAIAGLVGTGLVLQNNLSGDLPVAAGATGYSFKNVPSGSDYSITIKSQPTGPEQTCVVSKPTGTVVASNVSDASITCTTRTFDVGGPVTGLSGSGLVLQDGYGHEVAVASGASGYHFTLPSGANYAISVKTQPSNPRQNCIVRNGFGTVLAADVDNASVECTTNAYSVGGAITGLVGSGLVLQNGAGNDLPLASSATSYAFSVASGASYAITVKTQPTDPSQTCAVANGSGTVGSADVTGVDVVCTTNSYSVGGTITGYAGSGLVLQNNGAGDKTILAGATSYSFTVASGQPYLISVKTQPTGPAQNCVIQNASGTVAGGAVSNVNITCGTNQFLVGGSISGLQGSGLILQNGAGNELTIASDQTSYDFLVNSGASYTISVKTQPSGPTQTCTVANPSGTVAGADVSNVSVTCTTRSFTVGGTITGYSGSGLVLQNKGAGDQTIPGAQRRHLCPVRADPALRPEPDLHHRQRHRHHGRRQRHQRHHPLHRQQLQRRRPHRRAGGRRARPQGECLGRDQIRRHGRLELLLLAGQRLQLLDQRPGPAQQPQSDLHRGEPERDRGRHQHLDRRGDVHHEPVLARRHGQRAGGAGDGDAQERRGHHHPGERELHLPLQGPVRGRLRRHGGSAAEPCLRRHGRKRHHGRRGPLQRHGDLHLEHGDHAGGDRGLDRARRPSLPGRQPDGRLVGAHVAGRSHQLARSARRHGRWRGPGPDPQLRRQQDPLHDLGRRGLDAPGRRRVGHHDPVTAQHRHRRRPGLGARRLPRRGLQALLHDLGAGLGLRRRSGLAAGRRAERAVRPDARRQRHDGLHPGRDQPPDGHRPQRGGRLAEPRQRGCDRVRQFRPHPAPGARVTRLGHRTRADDRLARLADEMRRESLGHLRLQVALCDSLEWHLVRACGRTEHVDAGAYCACRFAWRQRPPGLQTQRHQLLQR